MPMDEAVSSFLRLYVYEQGKSLHDGATHPFLARAHTCAYTCLYAPAHLLAPIVTRRGAIIRQCV